MYTVHPSIAYTQTIVANLPQTTGKKLSQWLEIIAQSGLKKEKEIQGWLKKSFGLGQTSAVLLSEYALGKTVEIELQEYLKKAPRYVDALYAGNKSHLRPLHDSLLQGVLSHYPDIKVSPCKTMVPLYKNHVIAQIKPSTKTRIDFGLALKNASLGSSTKLIETGGFAKGDRITHRIEIFSQADITEELFKWLKIAYELDLER